MGVAGIGFLVYNSIHPMYTSATSRYSSPLAAATARPGALPIGRSTQMKSRVCASALCCLAALAGLSRPAASQTFSDQAVEKAIARGVSFL